MGMYYCTVTDQDKVGPGGGVIEEGEMIDVHEVPVGEALSFVMNEDINKPLSIILAVLWYLQCRRSAVK